jgi:hypothetical protein
MSGGGGCLVDLRVFVVVRGGVDYLMYRSLVGAVAAARDRDEIEEWAALDGAQRLRPVRIWSRDGAECREIDAVRQIIR